MTEEPKQKDPSTLWMREPTPIGCKNYRTTTEFPFLIGDIVSIPPTDPTKKPVHKTGKIIHIMDNQEGKRFLVHTSNGERLLLEAKKMRLNFSISDLIPHESFGLLRFLEKEIAKIIL